MMRPIIPEADILHFSLEGLLPKDHWLALNCELGTLALLSIKNDTAHPLLLIERQFTPAELFLILPLLRSFPTYCPYEVILASFASGNLTDKNIERARTQLHEALEVGLWDQQMRPVRNVMARARVKIRAFGLEINPILEVGYVLMPASSLRRLQG